MTIRPEVLALAAFGPLPPEEEWDEQAVENFAAAIEAVAGPSSAEERDALLALLDRPSEDSVWGVAWGVLHLLETAPWDGWQLRLPREASYWYDVLAVRWENYFGHGHGQTRWPRAAGTQVRHVHRQARLTGAGRPQPRVAAWRAAWGCLQTNREYAVRYRHLTSREHHRLTPTQAQTAVAAAILRQL